MDICLFAGRASVLPSQDASIFSSRSRSMYAGIYMVPEVRDTRYDMIPAPNRLGKRKTQAGTHAGEFVIMPATLSRLTG